MHLINVIILCGILSACGKPKAVTNTVKETSYISYKNVTCKVYNLLGLGFSSLPDFSTLYSEGNVTVGTFDELGSNSTVAFSLFRETAFESYTEYFGVSCESQLNLKATGNHVFTLVSDDGSKLFIDGRLVISHDGNHGMTSKSGTVNLTSGLHRIKVEYFNGGGDKGLLLYNKEPNAPLASLIESNQFVR